MTTSLSAAPPGRLESPALARALAIALCLCLTAGLSPSRAGDSEVTIEESFAFERQNSQYVFELKVPAGSEAVRLEIQTRVEAGEVSWMLRDSDDERRMTGGGIRGHVVGDTGWIEDPPSGIWILTVDIEDATGRARFEWTAR